MINVLFKDTTSDPINSTSEEDVEEQDKDYEYDEDCTIIDISRKEKGNGLYIKI